MKHLIPIIILIFITNCFADDTGWTITTTTGRVYRDCKVFSHDGERLTVTHSGGITGIKFTELPQDIQDKFNYNPEEAKRIIAQRKKEQEEREQALKEADARRAQVAAINQQKSQEINQKYQYEQARNKVITEVRRSEFETIVEVVQVLDDGFLARVSLKEDSFGKLRRSLNYDYNEFQDLVMVNSSADFARKRYERERFSIKLYIAGFYTYTTVSGARKKVFRFATTPENAADLFIASEIR